MNRWLIWLCAVCSVALGADAPLKKAVTWSALPAGWLMFDPWDPAAGTESWPALSNGGAIEVRNASLEVYVARSVSEAIAIFDTQAPIEGGAAGYGLERWNWVDDAWVASTGGFRNTVEFDGDEWVWSSELGSDDLLSDPCEAWDTWVVGWPVAVGGDPNLSELLGVASLGVEGIYAFVLGLLTLGFCVHMAKKSAVAYR